MWGQWRRRLFEQLIIDPSTGCLLWQGSPDTDGYGRISVDGKLQSVHRLMFEIFVGPIPPGVEPDHLCRIRHCAAPAHLELVTHKENMLRGEGVGSANAAKTHCDSGHEFTPENTYNAPGGRRECRTCNRERARTRRRTRKKVAV